MSERTSWSEDTCTCLHKVSEHPDEGRCVVCADEASWGHSVRPCTRYQWNGELRRRVW